MPKKHDFWVFTAMWNSARAKNFFRNVIVMIKSRCKFFCLVITQKANFLEQFEVWIFFLKIRFFRKFSKFQKFLKIFKKIKNFHEKIQTLKAITAINLNDMKILKINKTWKISWKKTMLQKFMARAHFLRAREQNIRNDCRT